MKKAYRPPLATLCLAVLLPLPAPAPIVAQTAAALTDDERRLALDLLDSSREEMLALVADVPAEEWNRKPAPDRWSVGETVEHVMLTEELLYGAVQQMTAGEPDPAWAEKSAGKLEVIQAFMPDRSRKATAPPQVTPTGRVERSECLERFERARAELRAFAASARGDVKAHLFTHPAFGDLNTFQVLVFVAEHNKRHNLQIAEARAAAAPAAR